MACFSRGRDGGPFKAILINRGGYPPEGDKGLRIGSSFLRDVDRFSVEVFHMPISHATRANTVRSDVILIRRFARVSVTRSAMDGQVTVVSLRVTFTTRRDIMMVVSLVQGQSGRLQVYCGVYLRSCFPITSSFRIVFRFDRRLYDGDAVVFFPVRVATIVPATSF